MLLFIWNTWRRYYRYYPVYTILCWEKNRFVHKTLINSNFTKFYIYIDLSPGEHYHSNIAVDSRKKKLLRSGTRQCQLFTSYINVCLFPMWQGVVSWQFSNQGWVGVNIWYTLVYPEFSLRSCNVDFASTTCLSLLNILIPRQFLGSYNFV